MAAGALGFVHRRKAKDENVKIGGHVLYFGISVFRRSHQLVSVERGFSVWTNCSRLPTEPASKNKSKMRFRPFKSFNRYAPFKSLNITESVPVVQVGTLQ